MTHPHSDKLISIKEKITEFRPEFDFSTTDYVQHQVWGHRTMCVTALGHLLLYFPENHPGNIRE